MILQSGYVLKSEKLNFQAKIQLSWLMGNYHMRFLQLTFVDTLLVTILEARAWIIDGAEFTRTQQTSAILGIIYCVALFLAGVIYLWVTLLP